MAEIQTRHVRVKAIRCGKFVEFDFSINDDDLSVELIMPFAAFEEFCRTQNAGVTYPDDKALIRAEDASQAAPRAAATAGLYHTPEQHRFPNE